MSIVNTLKVRFNNQSFLFKNIMTLSFGSTVSRVLSILFIPVLTVAYTPDDFGVLAIFISFSSMFTVISTGKYNKDRKSVV